MTALATLLLIWANERSLAQHDDPRASGSVQTASVLRVSSGDGHACAVTVDQEAICWGINSNGQTDVPPGKYVAISAGSWHTCAITDGRRIRCWGSDFWGQSSPPGGTFRQVSAGYRHSCGVETDGAVKCWGYNQHGESNPPAGRFLAVSSSTTNTCGLERDGDIRCWGSNRYRQSEPLDGQFIDVATAGTTTCALEHNGDVQCWGAGEPVAHPIEADYTDISGGINHFCGLRRDGQVGCFTPPGSRLVVTDGKLDVPVGTYRAVAAGASDSCAVSDDGYVTCWGADQFRQEIIPDGLYRDVAAGDRYTCAVTQAGDLSCWGGDSEERVPVAWQPQWDQGPFAKVSVGDRHGCALTETGHVVCWEPRTGRLTSVSDPPPGTFLDVDSSFGYSCAISEDHEIVCWGERHHGLLDTPQGSWQDISSGTWLACALGQDRRMSCWGDVIDAKPAFDLYRSVSVGRIHACAVTWSWDAVCWSSEQHEHTAGWSEIPENSYAAVSAGDDSACFLTQDGAAFCYSARGAGSIVNCSRDTHFSWRDCEYTRGNWTTAPNPPYVSVSAGTDHACALKRDGVLNCWTLHPLVTSVPESLKRPSPPVSADSHEVQEPGVESLPDQMMIEDDTAQVVPRLGRILARRLDDGRIEFAFNPTEGDRAFPSSRFLPPSPRVGRWYTSSDVSVDNLAWGRISARLAEDGSVEFSFLPTDNVRYLPRLRRFPVNAPVGSWLRSSEFDAYGQ